MTQSLLLLIILYIKPINYFLCNIFLVIFLHSYILAIQKHILLLNYILLIIQGSNINYA